MRHRLLGKTGLLVSEVGLGGIPLIRLSTPEAVRVLRRAYDRGSTFYDTANMYLDSEEKMGGAFEGFRPRLVLATKSMKRTGGSKGISSRVCGSSAPITWTSFSCTRSPRRRISRP